MKKRNGAAEALLRVFLTVWFAVFGLAGNGCAQSIQDGATGRAEVVSVQDSSGTQVALPTTGGQAVPAAAQNPPSLEGLEAKRSYAMGMIVGSQFRTRSVDVDLDLYLRGIRDALSGGQTLLTEREARATVSELQRELKRARRTAPPTAGDLSDIKVSFKLDPRLTQGMYMGDRWVSKPTFTSTVQAGPELTLAARAQGFDAKGRSVPVDLQWIPADPDMVAVTPGQGKEVTITVKRAGETRLKMGSGEFSKELRIKGIDRGNGIQVEISQ